MTTKSALTWRLAAGLLLPLAGCRSDARAWGQANSLIVIAVDSLWREVGDSVTNALEPAFATVRYERAFNVTRVSPMDRDWLQLRRFRQVISLGVAGDSWVAPVLAGAERAAPYLAETQDVWARGQRLTALVVSPERPAEGVRAVLPALAARLDSEFRKYAAARMYQSGANQALQDSLAAAAGFSLLLPNLYRPERRDSLYVFRNWTDVGGELRRTLAVSWHAGVDRSPTGEELLAWRDSVVKRYAHAQQIEEGPRRQRTVQLGELSAIEVQGAWSEVYDGVPMGGPFIARLIPCPEQDRTYLVDAWLYSPGRQKYEYVIQLETLLNTFRCGSATAPARVP